MDFKEFVTEDSDAVIAQIKKIRDSIRVIRMKRQLAKEKESLETMKREKRDTGINKHKYY
jgi:inorganic pyrophosphatase/exopolyphosphatase